MANAFSLCRTSVRRSASLPAAARGLFAAALALLLALAPPLGRAQTTITWVGTTADFGTAANWSTAVAPGAADIAQFSGTPTAATVTLGGATSLTGLEFAADAAAHTLDATAGLTLGDSGLVNAAATAQTISGSLTLGTSQIFRTTGTGGTTVSAAVALGGNTLIVSGAGDTTLSGIVSGSGGLTKSGTGTLTLSGASTYSGPTTVSGGTLAATATALGSGGTISVTSGALNLDGAFSANRTVTVDGANASLATTSYLEIGGTANGSLTVANGGTVTSGATIASSLGSGVASTISVTGEGSSLTAASTLYVGYTGSSTLTIGSGGSVTANSLTLGALAGSSGTLNLETGGTLSLVGSAVEHYVTGAGTAIINFSGGTLRTTVDGGSFYEITAPVTLTAGTTTTVDVPGDPFNGGSGITGVVSGSGNLLKTGTGTFVLAGDNTYTGNTVVTGGYIGVFAAGAPGTSALGTGTITLDGGGLRFSSIGCEDFSARIAPIGAGGATFAVDPGASVTFGTALTGSGPVTLTGGGRLTVAALGTGPLTVNRATLRSSGNFIADRAVSVGYGTLESAGYMEFGGAANGSLTITDGGRVTSASFVAFGVNPGVTGTGLVTGTGSSLIVPTTLYLAGVGGTGSLTIGSGGTVSAGDVMMQGWGSSLTLNAGGTLVLSGTNGWGLYNSAAPVTLAGGTIRLDGDVYFDGNALQLAAGTTSTFNTNGHDAYISNLVQGAGGLLKTGAGKLTLAPTDIYSTYTGGTTVTGGTLSAVQNAYLGAASGGVTLDGGTLQLGPDNYTRVTTLGSSGGTIDRANNPAYSPIVWAGAVSGPGALTFTGAGSLVLTGTNSYTGGTTVTGGILQIGADANLGAASGAVALNGTTLVTTGSFTTNRATTLGGSGATFNTAAGTTVNWQGIVSGSPALVKSGAGILALSGANTYAGGTVVNGGLVEFSTLGNFGSGTVTLDGGGLRWATGATTDPSARLAALGAGGATFDTHGNDVTFATALTGSGAVTKTGAGTLTVANQTALGTGNLAVTGGTLSIGGVLGADRAVSVSGAGATLTVTDNFEFGHDATGSLTVANGGTVISPTSVALGLWGGSAGTVTITGADSSLVAPTRFYLGYYGSGTLNLGGSGGGTVTAGQVCLGYLAGGSGTLNLNSGGTLAVGGTDGLLGGGGTATVNFAGGTVQATGSALTTSLPIALADATTSTIDTNALGATFSGVLSGTGALAKTGAGTLTLSGANTYTGGTTVSGGTLTLSGSGSLGGAIVDHANLTFARADDYTFNGVISGTGNVTNSGWIVRLSSAQTYTGATSIGSGGYLVLPTTVDQGLSAATTVAIAAGGALDISNHATTVSGLSGSGAVYSYGGTAGHLTVNVATGQSQTFAGELGSGFPNFAFTKAGSGTLTLTGANTYTGGTTLSGGTVTINNLTGSAFGTGAVTVASGATLTGAGTFTGALQNDGIYAPGNSPTLSTLAAFSQGAGGLLEMEIAGLARGTGYDALDVTGALTFGGTLQVTLIDGVTPASFTAGTTFNLFDWGSTSGTFSTVNLPSLSAYGLAWDTSALYTTGELSVIASAVPEPSTYAAALAAVALCATVISRRQTRRTENRNSA